ncbi:MAG: polysaccharide pyruvyl transferase family protein [Eubacterium sp.]|nr:polysaccharide pyruvyl transferase family protein [Eubacterium sp.]
MKKILMTTWYQGNNFGTLLQALSLKWFLEKKGNNVFIQNNFAPNYHTYNDIFISAIDKILKKINKKKVKFPENYAKYKEEIEEQKRLIDIFLKKQYCGKEIKINTVELTHKAKKEIDVFISGGDQIWNPYFLERHMMFDYLSQNEKIISFGTSIGVKKIPLIYRKFYRNMLGKYSFIGVREESSKLELEKILKKDVSVVVDPTMLLDVEEWIEIINREATIDMKQEKPYILCYFVGNRSYWKYIQKMKKETGYNVYVLPVVQSIDKFEDDYEYIIKTNPVDFIKLIHDAEIVCTDSFHATLYSVRLRKELYVLKRFSDTDKKSQNGRIYELLKKVDRENCIVQDEESFKRYGKEMIVDAEKYLQEDINYSKGLLEREINNE